MKKQTKEFIFDLLVRELDAEYIQDNPNPTEVEYVNDLIKAAKEFSSILGFPYDYIVKEKIEQLNNKD